MDFISNQELQIKEMLETVGLSNVQELFKEIPAKLKRERPYVDDGMSEFEGMQFLEAISVKNTFPTYANYLGGGSYEHHVPAIVGAICSKSEFLTSYTSYQAEASQGMLQICFEFQSAICSLTGMDASNASLYDGATACGEALLMALRLNKSRNKIIVASSLHPHYKGVIEQYLEPHSVQIEWISCHAQGCLEQQKILNLIDDQTAAILVQSPSFFGVIEDVKPFSEKAKAVGALTIISANPLAYGLYASASEQGADIAIGDTQPFGLPMQFGGPYVGYIACKNEYVRQLPGRIVGETVDTQGRRGFVLTLQAREQHIRREKATSNICSNQSLAALASLIGMLWYGKEGIKRLALTNFQRASYLRDKLSEVSAFTVDKSLPILNEFVVDFALPVKQIQAHFRANKIEPGIDLSRFDSKLAGKFLVAVTETKNKRMLDRYIQIAREL